MGIESLPAAETHLLWTHSSGQRISKDRKRYSIQCSCDLAANPKADCQSGINTTHEEIQCSCAVHAWNKSHFCQNCMAAVQMVIITLQQQAAGLCMNSIFYSLAAGHVIVVRVCCDSHISQLTELINTVVSVCRWNDMKWPIHLWTATFSMPGLTLQSFTSNKDQTSKDRKVQNAGGVRKETDSVFIMF